MSKKNKVELYEVLANHLQHEGQKAIDPLDESALLSTRRRLEEPRSGREIVFSLDGAFVIVVVVLFLIGTAFFVGYRRGAIESQNKFAGHARDNIATTSREIGIVREDPGALAGEVRIPAGKFTLRLLTVPRNADSLQKLRERRLELMTMPAIASSSIEVYIFDKGQNLSLGVGSVDSRDNEALKLLKDAFARETGAEFAGMSVESIDDLGRPVN